MKKFLLNELLYNGHLQSLGSAGIAIVASNMFTYKVMLVPLIISTYLLFQPIYYFDRYRGIHKDYVTNRTRTLHLMGYINKMPYLIFSLFVIFLFTTLLYSNLTTLFFGMFVMFCGFLYPLVVKNLTKYVFMLKNFYVASVHAILIFYPTLFVGKAIELNLLSTFLFFYILIEAIVMQIILDTKDEYSDKKEKLKTMAALIGSQKASIFALALSIINFISFIYFSQYLQISEYVLLGIVNLLINIVIVVKALKKRKVAYILSASKFFSWLLFQLIMV